MHAVACGSHNLNSRALAERCTEVALLCGMRRFALRVDQLPAWAFVCAAVVLFAMARAGRLFALVHENRGGMELGSIVTLVVFASVLIFAVRRRHVSAWRSTVHVLSSVVAGNAFALVLIWPFIPKGYAISLAPLLREALSAGTVMAVAAMPVAIAMLWLSRRYGSASQLTERRMRLIREMTRRRQPAQHPMEL